MPHSPEFRPLPHAGPTRRSIERDVDEEMRFHLQMRIEDLMRQGKSRDDAELIASREYGDMKAARSELSSIDRRTARRGQWREWLESVAQDVRFGVRGLRARPGFAVTVLLTLALGIGANAAIFSVVDAVLLRPLPFGRPERLVHLWETFESKVDSRSEASYPDYLDWRTRNRVFMDLAGYHSWSFLLGGQQATPVGGGKATANFFDVLGVHPILGRMFLPGEDAVDAPHVALLSYGLWEREFGRDQNVVGKTITLDGAPYTVVGVLPSDFRFARVGGAEVWTPIDRAARFREQRGNHWLNIVGRLRDGQTIERARENMSAIMRDLAKEYPPSNAGRDASVVPLRDELVGSVKPVILVLYAAVAVVLLVACANVANLLLMRGADRQREIAVRVALGAGQHRLIRQLLTESMLLAVAGGALGLVLAQFGTRALVGVIPQATLRMLPALSGVGVDVRVALYAMAMSLIAGVGFGIAPALRSTSPAVNDELKHGSRGSAAGGALRDGLVAAEIALTVILVSGAALFGRSLVKLLAIEPGFQVDHLATTVILLPRAAYTDSSAQIRFYARLAERVRAIPGVQDVGFTTKLPLDFGNSLGFEISGRPPSPAGQNPTASYRSVSTGYFKTLGIPLVSGRAFSMQDDAKAPLVAVVNRALARAYFENQNPIGQALLLGKTSVQIIGVVGDVPIGKIEDKIPPTLYFSSDQDPQRVMFLAMRTARDDAAITSEVRRLLRELAPDAGMNTVRTMDELLRDSQSVFMRRFPLILVGTFAMTALVLAIIGIYGVVSYSVAQRSREMGIRLALGAPPRTLVALVVRHAIWLAAIGVTLGIAATIMLGVFANKLLYGVRSSDPLTYVSVATVLAIVAVCATISPARRATRVDPALALRSD
jgi:putative ABC transport system permease protein